MVTRRTLMSTGMCLITASQLSACASRPRSVGLSLLFQNLGPDGIGVLRFAFDGAPGPGPIPGALGVTTQAGGKQMSFMPGDRSGGMPKFVDVEWGVMDEDYKKAWASLKARSDKYSDSWSAEVRRVNAAAPRREQRVDLTPIITPELVAKVMADPKGTHLKLTIVFKDGQVSIRAEADRWLDEEAVRVLEQVYPERKGTFR